MEIVMHLYTGILWRQIKFNMCCDVSKMVRWEDGNLPWKDKKRKRRQLKNLIGALENSHTKIYSQKKSEQATRKNPEQNYRKFHHILLTCTLLLPGAVQSWSAPSCLPQTRVIRGNLIARFQPTWELPGDWYRFHLTLSLNWRVPGMSIAAAGEQMCQCGGGGCTLTRSGTNLDPTLRVLLQHLGTHLAQ